MSGASCRARQEWSIIFKKPKESKQWAKDFMCYKALIQLSRLQKDKSYIQGVIELHTREYFLNDLLEEEFYPTKT